MESVVLSALNVTMAAVVGSTTKMPKDEISACKDVNFQPKELKCHFINTTLDCEVNMGYADYTKFVFCGLGPDGTNGALAIIVVWLLILFVGLGVTSGDFLCPALFVMSKVLRMSQNVAGVTLLAFGNGSPDIFSAMAGIQQGRPELVVGGLIGGGIFVTTVVVGVVFLVKPFKMMERPFLRDVIFYLGAGFWAFYLYFTGALHVGHALGLIGLYIVYIIVVVVSRLVHQATHKPPPPTSDKINIPKGAEGAIAETDLAEAEAKAKITRKQSQSLPIERGVVLNGIRFFDEEYELDDDRNPDEYAFDNPIFVIQMPMTELRPQQEGQDQVQPDVLSVAVEAASRMIALPMGSKRPSTADASQERNGVENLGGPQHEEDSSEQKKQETWEERKARKEREAQQNSQPPPVHVASNGFKPELVLPEPEEPEPPEWEDFLYHVCPIPLKEWKDMGIVAKVKSVLKSPILFLLAITCPVVSLEMKKNNWCRPLNVMHCITGPIFIVLISDAPFALINGQFPIIVIVFIFAAILAAAVYFSSNNEDPPVYHNAFAFLGFAVAVSWIYIISIEIVVVLQAIGISFNMSDTLIGLTILAWGNSLLDMLSNIEVARKGFPRMGVAACYGSPFLTLLLGVGIPSSIVLFRQFNGGPPMYLRYTKLTSILFGFLAISLLSTMICLIFTGFKAKRGYGVYLIGLYALFLILAVLSETGVF